VAGSGATCSAIHCDLAHLAFSYLDKRIVSQTRVGVEPFIKVLRVSKNLWQEKVEQSPEFVQVVLKWSSSQQQPEKRNDGVIK
jgi:hypothetical protein